LPLPDTELIATRNSPDFPLILEKMRSDPEKMEFDLLRSVAKVWGLARLSQLKPKAKELGTLC